MTSRLDDRQTMLVAVRPGRRAILLWKPTDASSVRLLVSHEDSNPEDSSLTGPALGEDRRSSDRPDLFRGLAESNGSSEARRRQCTHTAACGRTR